MTSLTVWSCLETLIRDAMAALIAILDERLRSGSKAVEDDVRRQQRGRPTNQANKNYE